MTHKEKTELLVSLVVALVMAALLAVVLQEWAL
jgi:hypothetical protein